MWFDINFYVMALQLLPTFLRYPAIAAYAQALLRPVDTLYIKWYRFRLDNIYKMEHNDQVCYMRKSLNDKFDVSERRIYIGEGNDYTDVVIYTEAEEQELYIGTEAENQYQVWLRTEAEMDTELDFIVYVPQELYNTQIYALRAHIDFYREGGSRYAIFIIP
jgi:hypothetical protein